MWIWETFFSKQMIYRGSGCGSVGRAVASDTRGLWIKSSHRNTFIWNICLLYTVWKRRKLRKRVREWPNFLKKNK